MKGKGKRKQEGVENVKLTPGKKNVETVLVVGGYFRQVLETMCDVRLDFSSRETARKRHQIRDEVFSSVLLLAERKHSRCAWHTENPQISPCRKRVPGRNQRVNNFTRFGVFSWRGGEGGGGAKFSGG
mgnify:CR=1 FL=1